MSRTITLIAAVGAALVVAAPASGESQPVEPQWMQAGEARSQELNRQYSLGDYSPAIRALKLRSEALNRQHGLGGNTSTVTTPPDAFERAVAARGRDATAGSGADITRPDAFERAVLGAQASTPPLIVRDHGDATQAKLEAQFSTPIVIVRDHGDATQAKLEAQFSTPLVIVRDHGDATEAKLANASRVEVPTIDSGREIEWPQVGAVVGMGILLALGLGLVGRALHVRPFAHR